MKPLKRNIQIALRGKRKPGSSKNKSNNSRSVSSINTGDNNSKRPAASNRTGENENDSIVSKDKTGSLAPVDTVIKLYYLNLTDSVLNNYKTLIRSFISRVGINKLSEVSLTDIYSNNENESIGNSLSKKEDLWEFINHTGISKYRIFLKRNKYVKPGKKTGSKTPVYLEIRFH